MSTTSKDRKKLFFSGVLVLTFANILIKVIGLMFKIPLTNIIGDEGMGYFNSAYTIYVWFYMISTAGLPVAVSIMISESRSKGKFREAKAIFRITLIIFIIIGLAGMALMMGFSGVFADIIGTEPVYMCILAIAPTLFFICISSAVRGYFQGYSEMTPTAVSQVIEAVGKLTLGILLATYAIGKGYAIPVVAAYAIAGLTIGAAAGMLFLIVAKLLFRESAYNKALEIPEDTESTVTPTRKIVKSLVLIAVPVTISASVMSLTNLIDTMIVIRLLKATGVDEALAVAMYGNYTALAVPMFNLPPVLIYPISYSIIPILTGAFAEGHGERAKTIMTSSLKLAAIIAIPCSLGLSVLSEPILGMFFKQASVETAAPLLSVLALSVFFVGMLSITNAILQASGNERLPIISMLSGAAVKLITSLVLIPLPIGEGRFLHMYGAPIGTFLCYLTITALNFYFMAKKVNIMPSVAVMFIRPFFASIICAASALGSYKLAVYLGIHGKISTVLAIGIAALVYAAFIFMLKAIDKNDILLLPKGEKIYGLLRRLKLIRQ